MKPELVGCTKVGGILVLLKHRSNVCTQLKLNNNTDHYFWNLIDAKTRFSFLKDSK